MELGHFEATNLVELGSAGGGVRFAGQRTILVDATALGILRSDQVLQLGSAAARALLTRFGHAQGWRLAEAMQSRLHWENEEDWRKGAGHVLVLQGMFDGDPSALDPLSRTGASIHGSFEAEQHLAHLGRSESPTCWMIAGLLSGYLSRASGQEIFVLEERCVGRGDALCHLLGRTREEWGDTRVEELRFFHSEHLKDWLDESLHKVTETLAQVEKRLHDARRAMGRPADEGDAPLGMVARSPSMRRLIGLARRVARVDTTVLITGESGTGKERIARLVHDESLRRAGPFVAVNCGAVTETLLESELFGHARGSFTGAVHDRVGLFEAANGGTLLLDEVGETSLGMQIKLLRAIQEREVRRIGETKSRPFNARIIAATNQDLAELIESGQFRKDLYYRLNVVELRVPPLRERREDVVPLARQLLADASMRLKRPIAALSPRAADQLLRYDWPGNVRELENAMERVVALAHVARTDVEDLPEEVRRAVPVPLLGDPVKPLQAIEKDYILAVLGRCDGNQTQAAAQLGIGTATLYRKLKAYGLVRPRRGAGGAEPAD